MRAAAARSHQLRSIGPHNGKWPRSSRHRGIAAAVMPRKNHQDPPNRSWVAGTERDRDRDRSGPGGERNGQRKQRDVIARLGRGEPVPACEPRAVSGAFSRCHALNATYQATGNPQRRQGDTKECQHDRTRPTAPPSSPRASSEATSLASVARLRRAVRGDPAEDEGAADRIDDGEQRRKAEQEGIRSASSHRRVRQVRLACRPRAALARTPPKPAARRDRRTAGRRSATRPASPSAVKPHGTLAAGFQDMLNG